MKELVEIIASPLVTLVLFSTTLHIICETFIDRILHTVYAHTQFFSLVIFWKRQAFKKEFVYLLLFTIYGCAGSPLLLVGGFSLIAESRGYSAVAMHGLLVAVTSIVEQWLYVHGLQ